MVAFFVRHKNGGIHLTACLLSACSMLALVPLPASASLIAPGATLVEVHSGPGLFEGPTWDPLTGQLYFSALTYKQLYRLTPPTTVALWMDSSQGINGTYLSNDGRLLCAQGDTKSILSMQMGPTGPEDVITLAHNASWNAPNDLCQTPNGDIYFTTPDFGATPTSGVVYHLAPGGAVTTAVTDMPRCNGVIASLDGQTLYVSDSYLKWWRSYPINPDGSVGPGSLFFNPSTPNTNDPDGMTIDEFGNLYLTGRGGVWIVSPAGQQLDMVPVTEAVSNLTFGGADGRALYLTCEGKVYSLAMEARGGRWANIPDNNQPPQVDAGPDQTVNSQSFTVDLDATVSDDGLPNPPGAVTLIWSKVSGPGSVSFADPSAVDTTVTFSAVGTYVLQLLAYDGIRSASDQVSIRIVRAGDLDFDNDVDQADFTIFWSCITGPGNGPPPSGCDLADLDHDQDIDQADFGLFQRCLSGPTNTSDPACAN